MTRLTHRVAIASETTRVVSGWKWKLPIPPRNSLDSFECPFLVSPRLFFSPLMCWEMQRVKDAYNLSNSFSMMLDGTSRGCLKSVDRPDLVYPTSKRASHRIFRSFHNVAVSTHFTSTAGDGVYAVIEGSTISLHDLKTNTTRDLVSLVDIRDVGILPQNSASHPETDRLQERGSPLTWTEWKLSKDMKYLMVKANWKKVRPKSTRAAAYSFRVSLNHD